jgi:hypothetical protein
VPKKTDVWLGICYRCCKVRQEGSQGGYYVSFDAEQVVVPRHFTASHMVLHASITVSRRPPFLSACSLQRSSTRRSDQSVSLGSNRCFCGRGTVANALPARPHSHALPRRGMIAP